MAMCLCQPPTIRELVVETAREAQAVRSREQLTTTLDIPLCIAAQKHAINLSRARKLYHEHQGEIIGMGARNPQDIVSVWMNSPGHRRILLSGSRVGFGCSSDGQTLYWVGLIR